MEYRKCVKIVRRLEPLCYLCLLILTVDCLMTHGNDVELSMFEWSPFIYLVIFNVERLSSVYRGVIHLIQANRRIVLVTVKGCYNICVIVYVVYLIFDKSFTVLTPILEDHIFEHDDFHVVNESLTEHPNKSAFGLPWALVRMVRFSGEDVEFECDILNVNKHLDVRWTLNDYPVKTTSRHFFSVNRQQLTDEKENVRILLKIHVLEAHDFGRYSCFINLENTTEIITERKMSFFVQTIHEIKKYQEIKEFLLCQHQPPKVHLRLPPGGIFKTSLLYRGYDFEDVIFYHSINNKSKELICEHGCSPLIMIYMRLIQQKVLTNVIRRVRLRESDVTLFMSIAPLCPDAFGEHTFSVFREIYNNKISRYELVEVSFPESFLISPRPSPFLTWGSSSATPNSQDNISISFLRERTLLIFVVEILLMIIVALCSIFMTYFVLRKIINPVWNQVYRFVIFIISLFFTKIYSNPLKIHFHRIYIACCDVDVAWSDNYIDRVLRSAGHTTYIHDRDTHPGQSELEGIRTGMEMCTRFVIVTSEFSVDRSPLWNYQVDVILDRLVRGELPEYNVLVVRIDGTKHTPLEDVLRVRKVESLEWARDNNNEECIQSKIMFIHRWLFSSKANYCLAW